MASVVPPLTISDIFGIFFIVLIIQFFLDLFAKEDRLWLKYLGAFLLSSASSTVVWIIITLFFQNTNFQDFIIYKPLCFYVLLFILFVFGIFSYLYSIKTIKKKKR